MTEAVKKEPRRAPWWVTPLALALVFLGLVLQVRGLTILAAPFALWQVIQHHRWHNWDVSRRAAIMREWGARDDED